MSRKSRRQRKQSPTLQRSGTLAVSPTPEVSPTTSTIPQQPPPLAGGRQTQPTNVNPLGLLSYAFLPRRQWQDIDLTDITSNRFLNAQQMLELFADLSPEVSAALWNKLRLGNSGWKYEVRTPNDTRELKGAKGKLDEFVNSINKDYGGINAIINSWFITAYLQGAVAGEIALTEDLSDVQGIYAIQPWTIHFTRDAEQNLVPFQQQVLAAGFGVAGGPFKRLNPTTFGYVPLDAAPDDPYGRPPAAPVLQLIAFDLSFLRDLRQAVHVNAFGRLQIQVLEEIILKSAPASVLNNPDINARRKFINEVIQGVRDEFAKLKPDDAFISTDAIKLDPVDFSGRTFDADKIARLVERRMIRALKELPVLMGSNEGTTETHGSIQLTLYLAAIHSLQMVVASILEKLLNVALQTWGINGRVKWTFEPVRAVDKLTEARAELAISQVAAYQRDQGFITQDDASIKATGSKAVAPAPVGKVEAPAGMDAQGETQEPKSSKPTKDQTPAEDAEEEDPEEQPVKEKKNASKAA